MPIIPIVRTAIVPYSINDPMPNLCKNCKYFLPNASLKKEEDKIKLGLCTLYGTIDLVDGSTNYELASISRKHDCKGKHWTMEEAK